MAMRARMRTQAHAAAAALRTRAVEPRWPRLTASAPSPPQDHVRSLAALTANVKRHGAPFRHMLFYGGCAGAGGGRNFVLGSFCIRYFVDG
jgi:hypothetical protein